MLLARAPRVAADECGLVWADAHGFSGHGEAALAAELVELLGRRGVDGVRAGVAATPVAAQVAAMHGSARDPASALAIVPHGTDRAYVGLFPLSVLDPDPRLRPLLASIGVSTCAEFAALDRESIEVRLGSLAVPLWKFARADDPRLIFRPTPPEAPSASLDWVEYALKDPMRLLFVLNGLIDRVCATLASTGEGARELTAEFALTDRSAHTEVIRASRATVNRRTWLRLIRTRLEQAKLRAAVTGISLRASVIAEREAPQGDLFDRGLASSQATEDAVARLTEDQGSIVVAPGNSAHPLLDERTTWMPQSPAEAVRTAREPELSRYSAPPRPQLHLQLASVPAPITVEAGTRRDHIVPLRYRDDAGWHEIVSAAGPERVSGRAWDGVRSYAREYFRCINSEGTLVWIFRNATGRPTGTAPAAGGQWFLHGWWD
ncbi:MAG: hypothetical protein IT356_03925 [Gemmatimonadaceae bacterium]|nr:hypothetical protein [Gemmatimonadaceae bacterium]